MFNAIRWLVKLIIINSYTDGAEHYSQILHKYGNGWSFSHRVYRQTQYSVLICSKLSFGFAEGEQLRYRRSARSAARPHKTP